MKDGYRYQDGKVLVTDYSNNNYRDVQIRHYQDNIDEILITENVLEDLDKLYDSIDEVINEDRMDVMNLKNEIFSGVFVSIFLYLLISLVLLLFGVKMITLLLIFGVLGGVVYKFGILPSMKNIKELEKKLEGNKISLEKVENEIVKSQSKLKELEENITRCKLDNPSDNVDSLRRGDYIQLDYVDKLKLLREYLSYCYVVGCGKYDFFKLYNIQDFESFVEFMKVDKELNDIVLKNNEYKVLKREFTDRVLKR